MNKRQWLWLLLALLIAPGTATAQNDHSNPQESHRDLPHSIDQTDPQEMMAQRLSELHEMRRLQEQFLGLLKDAQSGKPDGNVLDVDLQQKMQGILKGGRLSEDTIQKLRRIVANRGQKSNSSEEAERIVDNSAENASLPPSSLPPASSLPASLPPPSEPARSLFDRLQDKTTRWLIDNLEDVSEELMQALTEMEANAGNAPLAEILHSVPKSDFSGVNIRNNPLVPALRSETLSRYLSNAGDFLHRQSGVWDKVGSLFNNSALPSLPHVRGPSVSMRTPAAAASDGWLPALLSLLMLGVIVLVISRTGFGARMPDGSQRDAEWRLGPWPVPPSAVSTRQDLIRAFEYLVLLCLGPAAAPCHHHHLAKLLAEQDSDNLGRRHAAEMLAWLYEQARYSPDGETLSSEQLSDARHALCSLAGVTTA